MYYQLLAHLHLMVSHLTILRLLLSAYDDQMIGCNVFVVDQTGKG